MEPLGDGERRGIDAHHAVVPRRFVLPNSGGAGPDRASPDRRVNRPRSQRHDPPDGGGGGIGLQQAAAVRVGHIDGVAGDHDPVRPEVQALSSNHREGGRVDLHQPARVVGHPQRALAEGDALRTAQDQRLADHAVGRGIQLGDGRATLVALVVIAGPDQTSANGQDGTKVDGMGRDAGADLSRARVDADQAPIGAVGDHPHRASANANVPRIDRQPRRLPDHAVRPGVDAPDRRGRLAGERPHPSLAGGDRERRHRQANPGNDRSLVLGRRRRRVRRFP
jgi:hypothetical protein